MNDSILRLFDLSKIVFFVAILTNSGFCDRFPHWLSAKRSIADSGEIAFSFYRYDYYLYSDSTNYLAQSGIFESHLFLNDSVAQKFIESDFDYGYLKLKNNQPQKINDENLSSLLKYNRDSIEEVRWSGKVFGKATLKRLLAYSIMNASIVIILTPFRKKSSLNPVYAFCTLTAFEIPDIVWPRRYRLKILDK